MSMNPIEYLKSLSGEQKEAALTVSDPVSILACAGSGKTRTLIGRSIHLMLPQSMGGMGADPSSIMMVTFTNKAAREMRERIKPVIESIRETHPSVTGEPWIGTFHGLSLRILRVEAARAGLGHNFSIFDESDAASLAKEVSENLELQEFDVDDFFSDLEYAKARLYSAELLSQKAFDLHMAKEFDEPMTPGLQTWARTLARFKTPDFPRIYTEYQSALTEQNAVDFSDLMNRVTKLFQSDSQVRDAWRSSFRHFMVDEMQDMNRAQVAWLEMLTDGGRVMQLDRNADDNQHSNANDGMHQINGYRVRAFPRPSIAFVGDDDQSIYAFRGSDPSIMRLLGERNDNLQLRFLNESYRCQPSILKVADTLVGRNMNRQDKQIRAADAKRARSAVHIEKHNKPEDEIRRIVGEAKAHIAGGADPSQFAVLTRTRDLAKHVARAMRVEGLPVTEGKASDIRKTLEVKDAMSFAGFIANSDAEVYLRRIINKPSRGLGPTSMAKVVKNAKLKGTSFIEELRTVMMDRIVIPDDGEIYPKAFKSNMIDFGRLVGEMRSRARAAPNAAEAIREILEASGYLPDMRASALKASGLKPDAVQATSPREFLVELININDDLKDKAARDTLELGSEDLADKAGQLSEASRRLGNIALLLEQAEPHEKLDDFMQEATLEMSENAQAAGIQVMTIHASKGLEFDRVRMPFMMEGVFPHSRAIEEGDDSIEEERRLAYVALTRAREDVRISYSWSVNGSFIRARNPKPSRFVEEMRDAPRHDVSHHIVRNSNDRIYRTGELVRIVDTMPSRPVEARKEPAIPAPSEMDRELRGAPPQPDRAPAPARAGQSLGGLISGRRKAPARDETAPSDPFSGQVTAAPAPQPDLFGGDAVPDMPDDDRFAPLSDADFERMYAEINDANFAGMDEYPDQHRDYEPEM